MAGKLTVTVNLAGLKKFKSAFDADLRASANGPVRRAMQDWVTIVGRFLTERYWRFSYGGGTWAPLKPATLVRKEREGMLPYILRRMDLMFQSFAPAFNKPGEVSQAVPFGVRIKFGGGMRHFYPGTTKTIAEVAMHHQEGGPNLPQRKIIVPPDAETKKKMRDRMQQGVNEMLAETCSHVSEGKG